MKPFFRNKFLSSIFCVIKKVNESIAVNGFPSHSYDVTCQCYLLPDTSEDKSSNRQIQRAIQRARLPSDHRPGVELAISRSRVQRPNHYTTVSAVLLIKWLSCVCREAAQTAPHIVREPDVDVAREKAYKEGEDVIMACIADEGSNAQLVYTRVFFLLWRSGIASSSQFKPKFCYVPVVWGPEIFLNKFLYCCSCLYVNENETRKFILKKWIVKRDNDVGQKKNCSANLLHKQTVTVYDDAGSLHGSVALRIYRPNSFAVNLYTFIYSTCTCIYNINIKSHNINKSSTTVKRRQSSRKKRTEVTWSESKVNCRTKVRKYSVSQQNPLGFSDISPQTVGNF